MSDLHPSQADFEALQRENAALKAGAAQREPLAPHAPALPWSQRPGIAWLLGLMKRAWGGFGNPLIGIAAIVGFLLLVASAAVQTDILNNVIHLVGVMLIVLAAIFTILCACYFIFDHFLSFREFGRAIGRWSRGEPFSDNDTRMVQAMAVRSGLVFVGICILTFGVLLYLDFGGAV